MTEQRAVYTHGHQEPVLRSHRSRAAANSAAYLLAELCAGQAPLDVGTRGLCATTVHPQALTCC